MAPSELIERLSAVGCRLRADGEQLRVRAPEHALTDDLRQTIREQDIVVGLSGVAFGEPIQWVDPRRFYLGARFMF